MIKKPEMVKEGDRFPITVTASLDLTGSTVRLLAREKSASVAGLPIELACTITHAANGVVTHVLDGSLPIGLYNIELEVTQGNGHIITFPGDTYLALRVIADLD
jgi:hypothetical protein